jgi:hypothetical protein
MKYPRMPGITAGPTYNLNLALAAISAYNLTNPNAVNTLLSNATLNSSGNSVGSKIRQQQQQFNLGHVSKPVEFAANRQLAPPPRSHGQDQILRADMDGWFFPRSLTPACALPTRMRNNPASP